VDLRGPRQDAPNTEGGGGSQNQKPQQRCCDQPPVAIVVNLLDSPPDQPLGEPGDERAAAEDDD
jgi:hypothetical protein